MNRVCKAFGDSSGEDPNLIANPGCICPTAAAAMVCDKGHMLECHYPMTCREAQCSHYQRAMGQGGQLSETRLPPE